MDGEEEICSNCGKPAGMDHRCFRALTDKRLRKKVNKTGIPRKNVIQPDD